MTGSLVGGRTGEANRGTGRDAAQRAGENQRRDREGEPSGKGTAAGAAPRSTVEEASITAPTSLQGGRKNVTEEKTGRKPTIRSTGNAGAGESSSTRGQNAVSGKVSERPKSREQPGENGSACSARQKVVRTVDEVNGRTSNSVVLDSSNSQRVA